MWAYYANEPDVGRRAAERLLSDETLPDSVHAAALRNARFYAAALCDDPRVHLVPVEVDRAEGWSAFNPSLALDEQGHLHLAVRSSNYVRHSDSYYEITDGSDVIRSRTALARLDPDLALRGARWVNDSAVAQAPPLFPVAGLEDGRLIRHDGSWWLAGTIREHDARGICRIAVDRLDDSGTVLSRTILDGPEPSRHEKNWMPVVDESGLRFLYSVGPTVVTAPVPLGTAPPAHVPFDLATCHDGPPLARWLRGGSPVVRFDGGWLALAHQSIDFEAGQRNYLHRWLYFYPDLRLASMSRLFSFLGRPIEFAAGLAMVGSSVVVSFGVDDAQAWLATVPRDLVTELVMDPAA